MSRLGLFLVVVYFAHTILSVAYGATITDSKGQAVYFTLPLLLTPTPLYSLMPRVSVQDHESFLRHLIVIYPLAIAFSVTVLFLVGCALERISRRGHLWSVGVGLVVGLPFGLLWQVVGKVPNTIPVWLAFLAIGGIAGHVIFNLKVRQNATRRRA